MLRQNNIPVELYCYDTDLALNDFVRRIDHLTIDAKTNDQLLYFYSIYDANLEDILKIKFKQRIAYFHGITKPELLQVFDPELSVNCLKGLNQLKELQQFDVLAANSRASATTLISKFNNPALNINDITIIPPKLLEPKPALPIEDTSSQKKSPITKMLYVGRIKSNKKIEHLLFLFSEYQKLDPSAELWILGNNSDKAYSDYLNWVQEKQFKLPHNKVHWLGSVNDEELHQHYTSATVYVSMSEDEGFCLPILEAMLHNLPVFTYALPAIQEVMQDTGFIFGEKDFNHLAKNLFSLLSDSSKIKQITSKQRTRANQLATQMDGSTFLKLLSTTFLSKIS
jgi:glycosyltransferase involved in cell wall biosynthesis